MARRAHVKSQHGMTWAILGRIYSQQEILMSMIGAARSGTKASPSKVVSNAQNINSPHVESVTNVRPLTALREFESRELVHVRKLDDVIASNRDKETNVSRLFTFFSFDVMSDLVFGEPFNMLQSQKEHFAWRILHDGQSQLSFISPVPWLALVLRQLPGVLNAERRLLEWSMEQVAKRSEVSEMHCSNATRLPS